MEINELEKALQGTIDKARIGLVTEDGLKSAVAAVETKLSEIKEVASEVKNLQTDLNKIGTNVEALKQHTVTVTDKPALTLGEKMYEQLNREGLIVDGDKGENGQRVKSVKFSSSGRSNGIELTLSDGANALQKKAAVDMTTALGFGNVAAGYWTKYLPQVELPLPLITHAMDIFQVIPVTGKYFGIPYHLTYTNGADTKSENSAADESSFLMATYDVKVFDIRTYFRLSKNSLEDVNQLIAFINMNAYEYIQSKIDSKIFSAAGDNSTDIKGLFAAQNSTAFSAATYSATVQNPNEIDLIAKMKLQGSYKNFIPDLTVAHKNSIELIQGYKDTLNNSINDRRVQFTNGGIAQAVYGTQLSQNDNVGTDGLWVGTRKTGIIGLRQDVQAQITVDATDAKAGMITIVFDTRLGFGATNALPNVYCSGVAAALAVLDNGY